MAADNAVRCITSKKWVNDIPQPLINMQMTYLICKLPNWYSYVLDWYVNNLIDIHTSFTDIQILSLIFIMPWLVWNWFNYYANYFCLEGVAPNCLVLVAIFNCRHFTIWRISAIIQFLNFLNFKLRHFTILPPGRSF